MTKGTIRHIIHASLALPLVVLAAHGQPADTSRAVPGLAERADSLRVYHAPVVRVDASSIQQRTLGEPQPLSVVSRDQIAGVGAVDLSDAVAYAPGVFVKQYGGLGGLRTVSLRGTTAQQSVILIDGVRYRGSASGAFDLGAIPADALERVEIVRGGNAALYGANAVGGVINVVTRRAVNQPFAVSASAASGTFGERRVGLGLSGRTASGSWQADVVNTASRGDYPFAFNQFGATATLHRDNADLAGLYARAAWTTESDAGTRATITAQGYHSERGVPGAVVQGNVEQLHARLNESDASLSASIDKPLGAWAVSATLAGRANDLRYRDPDARIAGPGGIDNSYRSYDASLTMRARRVFGTAVALELGTEGSYTSLAGDNLDPSAGSYVQRTGLGAWAMGRWCADSGLFDSETALEGGVRADVYSDMSAAISPLVGVVWRVPATQLRVRAHTALGHRTPSFTEQYYLNYGNRDLRPEWSTTLDAGITLAVTPDLGAEAGAFVLDTRDQIVAVPRTPISWSATNVARTLTRGVEMALSGRMLDNRLGARVSYTLMRAEDRSGGLTERRLLVYAPQELFNGVVDVSLAPARLAVNWQYVSHRYTLGTNEYASVLPRYMLVGASVGWRIQAAPLVLDIKGECANLFNVSYQVIRNYPMPGRTLRLELVARY